MCLATVHRRDRAIPKVLTRAVGNKIQRRRKVSLSARELSRPFSSAFDGGMVGKTGEADDSRAELVSLPPSLCGIMPAHIRLERANLATPAPPRTDERRNHPRTTITDTLSSDPRPLLGRQTRCHSRCLHERASERAKNEARTTRSST